jgi:class 3 adenylate cyclase
MYVLYKDSIFNEENTKKLTQAEMQYEFDKKEAAARAEQEKKDIRQSNIRNAIVAGLTGTLIFLVVVYRQRNKISKARERSDELLLNILPHEVANELKEKGRAEAKHYDEVSVLFTDFVHFTQTAEKLTPQQLVQELHECFTAFDEITERHGLEKIKTIGDAYLAVCGLPNPSAHHAQQAVLAALEIRDFIAKRNATHLAHEFGPKAKPFEIRIGVNSGSVVAGIVGVKKFAYDIWGDTVNIAARMESSGEPGKVNISQSAYNLVKDHFTCEHRGKIKAKGKGEMDMYFVHGQA